VTNIKFTYFQVTGTP